MVKIIFRLRHKCTCSFAPFNEIALKYNKLINPALAQDTDSRLKDQLSAYQFSCSTIHIQNS